MSSASSAKKLTLIEALKMAEGYLSQRGVADARLSAEHLLAHRLNCSRLDLYLRFDSTIPQEELEGIREDLRRRGKHYPLQYILGEVEFMSLVFKVREGVFIPRPETEVLVEKIEEETKDQEKVEFLEFGVGCGVISGSLSVRHPLWRGVAFDRSAKAVLCARENLESLGVHPRVRLFVADSFASLAGEGIFDILFSNPPYVRSGDIASLDEEVSRWEDISAIDGGESGLEFYHEIAIAARRLLRPDGLLAVEVGDGQGKEVSEIFARNRFSSISVKSDYNRRDRVVTARVPGE